MDSNKKKCPYCGEEIMASARKCRHCHEWLDGEEPHDYHAVDSSIDTTRKDFNALKYILTGVVVVALIVVAIILIPGNTEPEVNTNMPTSDTILPSNEPYSIDQVLQNIEEYDANETEEEKAQEPWRIHLDKLQGSYLIDKVSTAADLDMIHTYGKYVVSGNTLTKYEWNENSNSWIRDFSSEFQLFKFQEDGYMTGYNLIYIDNYGNECRICSGDLNEDGKMDLWQSDNIFWTKQ